MTKTNSPVLISALTSDLTPQKIKDYGLLGANKNPFMAFQHNELVQAKYSMTLQQKRIMLWLISKIQPSDIDFKEHTLSVRELIEICDLSGESSYTEIKDLTFSLVEKGIRIIDINSANKKREIQVSWLSSADYYEGQVKLSFSPKLKPYLLQLKDRFTALSISDLMQFKSVHAIRIYELLKQYENIGERTLTIEEIKGYCGVINKLKTYPNFEKKILLIAQKEINTKSDIKFDFERKKSGRKITGIRFIIKKNKTHDLKNNPKNFNNKNAREITPSYIEYTLKDFGLPRLTIKKIMKNNTEAVISNAIKAVDRQIEKGRVRNAKAMLLTAIKEKWGSEVYKS